MLSELVWTHFGEYSMPVQNVHCTRRMFTTGLFAGVFGGVGTQRAFKSDPPFVANPRATDGDDREQPRWEELLTITVGTRRVRQISLAALSASFRRPSTVPLVTAVVLSNSFPAHGPCETPCFSRLGFV
jgi:hypothetical protein